MRSFPNGREGAVRSVPLLVRGAWKCNLADAVAEVLTDNGSMLVGDKQLDGREEIRAFLTQRFAGDLPA
jgi:uncharacterized protein (TIGR02246 family)